MTHTVSISDFRQNISDYISLVQQGNKIILTDKKRGKVVAEIIKRDKTEVEEYKEMLKRVAGTFTAKNHPEWATRRKVNQWLRKTRLNSNRNFDDYPGL